MEEKLQDKECKPVIFSEVAKLESESGQFFLGFQF